MAKENRSQAELTEVLRQHLGIDDLAIVVRPDQAYGWNAFAMNAPDGEPHVHAKLQWAVEELRKKYELVG